MIFLHWPAEATSNVAEEAVEFLCVPDTTFAITKCKSGERVKLFSCQRAYCSLAFLKVVCWWFGGGVTPVLIPNTAVKPTCADGSRKARVGRRQHRAFKCSSGSQSQISACWRIPRPRLTAKLLRPCVWTPPQTHSFRTREFCPSRTDGSRACESR